MATWDDVRTYALALPEVVENSPHGVLFTTSHFDRHPAVLVRLAEIGRDELRELIVEARLCRAPKRLIAAQERRNLEPATWTGTFRSRSAPRGTRGKRTGARDAHSDVVVDLPDSYQLDHDSLLPITGSEEYRDAPSTRRRRGSL
jgi:hypothetical protein